MIFNLEMFDKIVVIIINIAGILLGGLVLFSNPKSTLNRRFVLMTISSLLWVDCAYLAFSSKNSTSALSWYRYNGVSALLTILIFYHVCVLAFSGSKEEKKYPILNSLIFIIFSTLTALTAFTDIIFKNAKERGFGMELIYGKFGEFLFYIIPFAFILITIAWLVKKYFNLAQQEKLKVQYFLIGILLWCLFNSIFNAITPLIFHTVKYQHLGDYSVIFLLGFTTIAIVKRQLFGIKVVLAQLLVGLIGMLLFINVIVSQSTFEYIWKGTLFVAFVVFGWLLVKGVLREIKLREQLYESYGKIKEFNETLEQKVEQRTSELEKEKKIVEQKMNELEKFYQLTVGRELKMIELKDKIKNLEGELQTGKKPI